MATLNIDLRYISDVEGSIKKAVNEIDRRQSDYEGIVKDVNKISSSTGNLSDCNIYLKKKNSQLQGKMDKLNSFKNKVSTFSANASAADGRVATYVTDQSNTFYKTVGIKTGWAAGWESFKKGCKTVWKTVTDFYEKHKYVIDFVVDLALLAVAVVALVAAIPTGGATLFFAGFALAQSLGDIFTSSVALGFHISGDDEHAGIWAERGLKDGVKLIGKGFDAVAGLAGFETDIFENLFGFAYDVVSISSIIYSAGKLGKNLFKSIDLRNTNDLTVFKRFTNASKNILGYGMTGTSGKDLAACWQIKELIGLKSVDSARKIMLGCDFVKNLKTTVKTIDSIYKGTFLTEGNKVGSTITKTVSTIKNFYRDVSVAVA